MKFLFSLSKNTHCAVKEYFITLLNLSGSNYLFLKTRYSLLNVSLSLSTIYLNKQKHLISSKHTCFFIMWKVHFSVNNWMVLWQKLALSQQSLAYLSPHIHLNPPSHRGICTLWCLTRKKINPGFHCASCCVQHCMQLAPIHLTSYNEGHSNLLRLAVCWMRQG